MEALQRHLDEAVAGQPAGELAFVFAGCNSLIDPSRAPGGEGVVKLITFAPYAVDGHPGNWDRYKETYAMRLKERLAQTIVGYAPGDELASLALSPVDIEARNPSYLGGAPAGGEMLTDQLGLRRPMLGYAHYRMPVAGLYQTGVTTHPGAPVSGWPGRHAAHAILTDLGHDADAFFASVAAEGDPGRFRCDVVTTAGLTAARTG